MPAYLFEIAPFLAGRSVTVRDASGSDVASGTLDANAKFTATLPVGDYVASASDGNYTYRASGVVDQGDPDRLSDSALSSTFARRDKMPLRRRDVVGAPPRVMATPPTITRSAASAASSITNSVLLRPENKAAFRYLGANPVYGSGYPLNLYYSTVGMYANSSTAPWSVEFDLDSVLGKFEVETTGAGNQIRVMVDGQLVTAGPTNVLPADGNTYKLIVDFGAAVKKRIRVEFSGPSRFGGIRVGPGDGVTATAERLRCVIVGDSYTEPTIVDSGTPFLGAGFAQWVGYLTGWDVRSCGSGGTGYLNPSTGGKVKLRDRLADVWSQNPDVVIICMGLNDRGYAGVTAAALQAEVAAVIAAVQARNPRPDLFIASQWWPGGPQSMATSLLEHRDAIKAAATAAGVPFLDTLQTAAPIAYTSTLTADAAINATAVSVADALPARADGARDYWLQIGTGSNAETKFITGQSGTGPYSVQHGTTPLLNAHTAGETVRVVGASFLTGTGKQSTPANNGNADRYIGSDGSHPTGAGHEFLGEALTALLSQALTP